MCNHIHILLEVPPMAEGGLSDSELLKRLSALYSEAFVGEIDTELASARTAGNEEMAAEIHARFSYRMHDLGQFMKGLLQRFTQWFNRVHKRSGTLWEQRFKSVIVESGTAARTMAAYIDLNPVRAGMVEDPADYRWSSYGEAIGGGKKGDGKKARIGLIRACQSDSQTDFSEPEGEKLAAQWKESARIYRGLMGLALGRKSGKTYRVITKNGDQLSPHHKESVLPELKTTQLIRKRVRYFSDGAVIGSKEFVNEAFAAARERFSEKRKDGARKIRGQDRAARDSLWSVRNLRVRV